MNPRHVLLAILFGILIFSALFVVPHLITATLLFGWIAFINSAVRQVEVHPGGLAVFVASFGFSVACADYLLRWLVTELNVRRSPDQQITWKFRASISMVLLCMMLFVLGIAVSGVTHQTAWLATSPTPIFVGKIQVPHDSELSTYRPNIVATTEQQSWLFQVLPFLPYIQPEVNESRAWNSAVNADAFRALIYEAICPSMGNPIWSPDGFGLSHNAGNPEVFAPGRQIGFRDFDSLANSIAIGEVDMALVPWADPTGLRPLTLGIGDEESQAVRGKVGYGSLHHGGAFMLMGDGSTRFVQNSIDPRVLEQLGRRTKGNLPLSNSSPQEMTFTPLSAHDLGKEINFDPDIGRKHIDRE